MTVIEACELHTVEELLARVEAGEEVVIARAGREVARVTRCAPEERPRLRRVPGTGKGYFIMSEDFDAPLPKEMLDAIYAPFDRDLA